MKNSRSILRAALYPAILAVCAAVPGLAFARAGGGGGSGGGGGGILMLPIILIYLAILHYRLYIKSKEARELLGTVSRLDPAWNIDSMKTIISETFFKVQRAWMERDQTIARDRMSKAIYENYKAQTDQMKAEHKKNMMEKVELLGSRIVSVLDYKDDTKDSFWVYIEGSMIDYTINDQTNEVISGTPGKAEKFTELWKFIREPQGWVLDKIDPEVSLDDLKVLTSMTES